MRYLILLAILLAGCASRNTYVVLPEPKSIYPVIYLRRAESEIRYFKIKNGELEEIKEQIGK